MDPENTNSLAGDATLLFEMMCGILFLAASFSAEDLERIAITVEGQLASCPSPAMAAIIREQFNQLRRFRGQFEAERVERRNANQPPSPFSAN